MTILIPRDALLADLFPDAGDDIEGAIATYYSVGPVRPTVMVEANVVRIEIDVEQTEAYQADLDKATGFARRGKTRHAREILERLVERYPAESDLHRMLAQTYFEAGDGEAAVDPLIDALRWDPDNRYALILMGNVQFRTLRDTAAAQRYYDRAAALDPDDHLVLNNLGAVMMDAGKYEEARRYFDLAKGAEPDYPNTHLGIALSYAHQGDMVGAFSNAVRALKRAGPKDPVHGAALDAAQKAASAYTRQTPPEDLFQAYAEEVADAAGKPVDVEAASDIQTPAKIEIAEYRGLERHVVKYKPGAPAVAHLVAHELAHLDLIAEARTASANRMFTTREALRQRFAEDTQRDVQRLIQKGLPGGSAAEFVASLYDGLNSQVYNAPVDLFIEDLLHRRHLELRPVQFASLFGMLSSYAEAATNKEIRAMTPQRVFETNVILNLTHALQFRDLYGVDLTGAFKADRRLVREAERLYAEFTEVRGDRKPGEEYDFVADWARDLKVDAYFELVTEAAPPPSGVSAALPTSDARTVEDAVSGIEADPLNLEAEERAAAPSKGMSLKGSPAASMAVTMYLVDALKLFRDRGPDGTKAIAFEVGMLGNYGLDADDPAQKYTLQSVPGKKFSALHLLAYMYAGFREIEPSMDTGLRFEDEYETARTMLPLQ